MGAAYWLIPRVTRREIYNRRLMNFNFWLMAIGFIFFFLAMTGAGLQQNSNWYTHINVVETLPTLKIWFVFRAIAGGVVVVSAFIFAYNLFMTLWASRKPYMEETDVLEPVKPSPVPDSAFQLRSQNALRLSTIVTAGLSLFIIMTFMVVAMPYMYTNNEPGPLAHVLTEEEESGMNLYRTLGCQYYHNQFVRTQDWAMGTVSDSGDFYYSVPNFLGTERTGPSLSQIGGKRATEWHIDHYNDPRSVSPSSIMPEFDFLSDKQLSDLVSYIQTLGTENLDTQDFQPLVPSQFADKANSNTTLYDTVAAGYDAANQTYSGSEADGAAWADIFDQGKQLFLQKCSSCHGCAGNGQGSYARQLVTRPANLHERLVNYPENRDAFQFWRIHEGVPGTGMPAWGISTDEDVIWLIATYENSFQYGAVRTIDGGISDSEGDDFDALHHPLPQIAGTETDFQKGGSLYNMYCAQCHGSTGLGDGPASIASTGGYIDPQPANFEESGKDFTNYGRWVWKVREGVETTNMPPWMFAFSDKEIYQVIFYIQTFSTADDYNSKWAPLYTDSFARNFKR